jgi:hypothetical protein
MTNERSSAKASGADAAPIARRLLLFAMTAAVLALAGCGDSGDDSEDDASHAGCRTLAADPALLATTVTGSTRWSASWAPAPNQ